MGDEHKVFVGKLPGDIHEDEMKQIFGTYGKVTNVHILPQGRDGPDGSLQKCGFVTYDTAEGCKTAIQVLNEVYKFREEAKEPIQCSVAKPRRDKGDKGGGKGWDRGDDRGNDRRGGGDRGNDRGRDDRWGGDRGRDDRWGGDRGGGGGDRNYDRGNDRGGYDRGNDRSYDDRRGGGWDRGNDRSYDDRRGGGWDRDNYDRNGGYGKGGNDYGKGGGKDRDRSHYNGSDGGKGGGYDKGYDRGYDRDRGQERDSRGAGGGDRRDDRGAAGSQGSREKGSGRGSQASSPKLYIGNLPVDIQKETLEQVFKTYGTVEDIHVMGPRGSSGQACAFVKYGSSDEARQAIQAMESGYEIRPGEGNIVVKFADQKPRGEGGKGGDSRGGYDSGKGGYDRDSRGGGYGGDYGKGGRGHGDRDRDRRSSPY